MKKSIRAWCVAAVIACGAQGSRDTPYAAACGMAWARGASPLVHGEEALIVWDWRTRTEHFVRRIDFSRTTAGADFAFLVPTPSRPLVADADETVFNRLADAYSRPRTPTNRQHGARSRRTSGGGGGGVTVVQQTFVAGLEATTIRSDSANALAQWLGQHGFTNRPALAQWLQRYTGGTWHITAFRYAGQGPRPLTARAVRLSFSAERPFYPYGEPRDQAGVQEHRRPFRLSVISSERVEGRRGSRPWSARTGYAERREVQSFTGTLLPLRDNERAWVTTFDEPNSVRNDEDLVFVRATAQTPVAPSIPRRERDPLGLDML